jgi:hypothetical protein
MLDLDVIRRRAATRANTATPANAANWLTQTGPKLQPISQLATVAGHFQTVRSCADCLNRSRFGTCREPVAAGLAEEFTLVWAEPEHAATCLAWTPRATP